MRCDICGGQIPKGQGASDTEGERIGNPFPTIPTRWSRDTGIRHKVVVLNLCPACVEKRDRREMWIWLALGFFIVVGAIIWVI